MSKETDAQVEALLAEYAEPRGCKVFQSPNLGLIEALYARAARITVIQKILREKFAESISEDILSRHLRKVCACQKMKP